MVAQSYWEANSGGVFLGDESRIKLLQMAETIERIAPYLKSTLAGPLIYDKTYPEKLSIASPANPMGVTNPMLFLLSVQWEEAHGRVDKSWDIYSLIFSGIKSMRKVRSV